MDPQQKTQYRMGNQQIINILFVAGFVDALTLIPLVGDFMGPLFWALFSLYLFIKGYGFLNTRRLVTTLTSTIFEILPGFQAFPTIFIGSVIVILLLRVEDKTGLKLTGNNVTTNIRNIKNNTDKIKTTGRALVKYAGRQIGQKAGREVGEKIGGEYGGAIGRGVGGSLGGKAIASRTGHPVQRNNSSDEDK